ncbi:MAG: hypothetical protein ABI696_03775 [Rubrivivax sp.]
MLQGFKRLFARAGAAAGVTWDEQVVWAEARRYVLRTVRDGEGFIVEGQTGNAPWRLEWGPSQRSYVAGNELRLRAEVGPGQDVQALVLDRTLQSTMESAVFDQYVDGVQTRIDTETPPEMRWLVMHPKLSGAELGALRERFAAVTAHKPWLLDWLAGPLTTALQSAPLAEAQPLVLMLARGRLTLRTGLADPDPPVLDAWLRLFTVAQREARRVADRAPPSELSGPASSLWAASQVTDGNDGR